MAGPTSSQHRIIQLDALRGLAVIGIVWMNVYAFALPFQAYSNPIVWGGDAPVDRWVWAASFVFIEDKFRTLFAMLFGVGCLILIERDQERKTRDPWRAHYARMTVLMVIGLVHSVLLASNDVLRAYALAGLLLPLLMPLSHRALYAVSIGLVVVHVGGGLVTFGAAIADFFAGRLESALSFVTERQFGAEEGALRFALELGREGLGERVVRRIDGIPSQLSVLAASVPINLAAMTLGMGLWKGRLMRAEWRTFQLQRLAAISALIAVPGLLALAWWVAENGFPGALAGPTALVFSTPFDVLLALSYAALAMALFAPDSAVSERLAAVGRLSLTNYLMSSVILAAIFASWGLGLFAELSRTQAFVVSFVPIAAMLCWSPIWLARKGQGPFERLWRWASARLS